MLGKDTPTLLAEMQALIQAMRDLALIAPPSQKAYLLQAAEFVEQATREFDKSAK
jgi:hypothetical protein